MKTDRDYIVWFHEISVKRSRVKVTLNDGTSFKGIARGPEEEVDEDGNHGICVENLEPVDGISVGNHLLYAFKEIKSIELLDAA